MDHGVVKRMGESTWSSGLAPRMRSELPSLQGGKTAPYPVKILPPVWAPPVGSTIRFRERKMYHHGEVKPEPPQMKTDNLEIAAVS